MEEQVGKIWHNIITHMVNNRHPEAAVRLEQVKQTTGILFRALGGDSGLQIESAGKTQHAARRSWLQRLAGTHRQTELAWRDERTLRLPAVIDCFPTSELNRDLYLWLATLATGDSGAKQEWFKKNQQLTAQTLAAYPGLQPRYDRLVEAHLKQRTHPDDLPPKEAVREKAIRNALLNPSSEDYLPPAKHLPQPVLLWLHPAPPLPSAGLVVSTDDEQNNTPKEKSKELEAQHRRQAEQITKPEPDRGLVAIRMENILSWGEFSRLDRGTEENEDLDQAADIAKEMEQFSVTRDGTSTAGRLRFDLDLPAAENDDQILNNGILLPEWDYKTQQLQPDHCRLLPMLATTAEPCELPDHLRKTAKRLRAQFRALAPARTWYRGMPDGSEIDMDAYLRFTTDRAVGKIASADGLYRDLQPGARSLACLLLADLSLSTDTWINNQMRVIDVIRDSLFLFSESLSATRDRFAMYGFSSRRRDPVRFHQIKTFDEIYNPQIRGRISAIKPGYYTRMGAAIRHASRILKGQPAGCRLLLLLTDGKPNDLDKYEGRYGIEDTRHAINEARQLGLQPFCVTVDNKASGYLPHLFGAGGFVVIHKPSELPKKLPLLYAHLTQL